VALLLLCIFTGTACKLAGQLCLFNKLLSYYAGIVLAASFCSLALCAQSSACNARCTVLLHSSSA
jgi:hypothetical protein